MTNDELDAYIQEHLPGAAGQPDWHPSRNYNDAMVALDLYRGYNLKRNGRATNHRAFYNHAHEQWEFTLGIHEAGNAAPTLPEAIAWALYLQLEHERQECGLADANLMAASVDLLAACEATLDWFGWDTWCDGPTCPWGRGEVSEVREGEACEGCQRREGLRVAVARAKGEVGR